MTPLHVRHETNGRGQNLLAHAKSIESCTHYDHQIQRGSVHVLSIFPHTDILDVKLMFRIRSNNITNSSTKGTACFLFLLGWHKGLQNITERAYWSTRNANSRQAEIVRRRTLADDISTWVEGDIYRRPRGSKRPQNPQPSERRLLYCITNFQESRPVQDTWNLAS